MSSGDPCLGDHSQFACGRLELMPAENLFKMISADAEAELLVHCARLEIDAPRAANRDIFENPASIPGLIAQQVEILSNPQ